VRASVTEGAEALADRVLARRMRREVLVLCDTALQGTLNAEDAFWASATKVEALQGLGRQTEADALRATISAGAVKWMVDAMTGQLSALDALHP